MERRTEAHLARADHHRDVALALLTPTASSLTGSPPSDWAVVAAVYAAVHYVNAYLWETQRYEPRDHQARSAAVGRTRQLRPATSSFETSKTLAYQARYARHVTATSM